MNLERVLKIEKGIYLKTENGVWKKFNRILREILEEHHIKLKKRKFRVNEQGAWGGRRMGKNGDEIWIYAKLPQKEIAKTLIYEIAGIHYEDDKAMKGKKGDSLLEEIAQKIWQDKDCREMVKTELLNLKIPERIKYHK